jgi:biotin transport system substrate-specific component
MFPAEEEAMSATHPVQHRVLADVLPAGVTREVSLVLGGAGLTGLAAQASVVTPLSPVPFTLQTLAVLLVGGVLGSTRGVASMILYVVAGAAGVPWFAHHSSGVEGATIGYLAGFVAAAWVVGFLAQRRGDRRVRSAVSVLLLGTAVVYALGVIGLIASLHVGPVEALRLGVVPFVLVDLVKVVVAGPLLPLAWRVLRRGA